MTAFADPSDSVAAAGRDGNRVAGGDEPGVTACREGWNGSLHEIAAGGFCFGPDPKDRQHGHCCGFGPEEDPEFAPAQVVGESCGEGLVELVLVSRGARDREAFAIGGPARTALTALFV